MSAVLQHPSHHTQLLAKEVVQNFLHRRALSIKGKNAPGTHLNSVGLSVAQTLEITRQPGASCRPRSCSSPGAPRAVITGETATGKCCAAVVISHVVVRGT